MGYDTYIQRGGWWGGDVESSITFLPTDCVLLYDSPERPLLAVTIDEFPSVSDANPIIFRVRSPQIRTFFLLEGLIAIVDQDPHIRFLLI